MGADTRTVPTEQIVSRLRAQCESLRRKPTPLADLIPLLQEAADAIAASPAAPQAALASAPAGAGEGAKKLWLWKNLFVQMDEPVTLGGGLPGDPNGTGTAGVLGTSNNEEKKNG